MSEYNWNCVRSSELVSSGLARLISVGLHFDLDASVVYHLNLAIREAIL